MNYWCMVNTFVLRGLFKTLFDSLIKTTKWTRHKIRKTFSRLLVLRWCIYGMVYITLVTQLLYLTLSLQIMMSYKISFYFTYKEKKRERNYHSISVVSWVAWVGALKSSFLLYLSASAKIHFAQVGELISSLWKA